jgi:hypothetical protein
MENKETCKPRSFAEQTKDPKVAWAIPKRCFVVTTPISDVHFKRLRRWLDKKTHLEMMTHAGHELIIINSGLVSTYNAKKARKDLKCQMTVSPNHTINNSGTSRS